ncbi:DUF2087 domain-containing protein [Bartonella sp. DGB1]|uniref:DUF2087 domain-containing protein n=1 Tax=Bartonella sp. DGB1 TaxID=3239807 RepID=UPI0035261815
MTLIRPGMRTENSAHLISALIKMSRPKLVVEIGAGDSTIFILNALKEAVKEWLVDKECLCADQWSERDALLDPTYINTDYQPLLITIDDFTACSQSAQKAWEIIKNDSDNENYVNFINENFFNINKKTIASWGKIDFAWIDAGSPADNVSFVANLWEHLADGAYLVLPEPTMLTTVNENGENKIRCNRTPLWEELLWRLDDNYEAITFPESHKYRQGGLGIIRKRQPNEKVFRTESLQTELLALEAPPIRNDILPIGNEKIALEQKINYYHNIMSNDDMRYIYAIIILESPTVKYLLDKTGINIKKLHKYIEKMQRMDLIKVNNSKNIIEASSEAWNELHLYKNKNMQNLSDKQLETDEILKIITNCFKINQEYNEDTVSKICFLFSVDYARLRRCLVDKGYLKRNKGIYRRILQNNRRNKTKKHKHVF